MSCALSIRGIASITLDCFFFSLEFKLSSFDDNVGNRP